MVIIERENQERRPRIVKHRQPLYIMVRGWKKGTAFLNYVYKKRRRLRLWLQLNRKIRGRLEREFEGYIDIPLPVLKFILEEAEKDGGPLLPQKTTIERWKMFQTYLNKNETKKQENV